MGSIREVRKRDNRVVPFDRTKIADAIYKAIRSVGKGGRPQAEELAAAVTHFLEEKFEGRIPGIEDIQDLVETVLIETGNAEVAKAYILYRNKRAALREVLQVRKDREGGPGAPELVEDRLGVAPWSKQRIVAALIREAEMEAGMAEEIASTVERKVFSSGLRRISTSLIRELVDNELFERGFSSKLRRQAPIGLPKYNLEQIIFGSDSKEGFTFPKTPLEVQGLIATQILAQYALEEVYSPGVADAHREGRLHLHGLGNPVGFDRLSWDLDSRTFLDPAELFARLSRLSVYVAGEIRLRNPERLLGPALRAAERLERVESIYGRLGELLAVPCAPVLALEVALDRRALPWLRVLADRPPQARPLLYLRLGEAPPATDHAARGGTLIAPRGEGAPPQGDDRAALELAAALFERGEPLEFLPPSAVLHSAMHAPEGRAGSGLRAAAAPITINLPRAAFRSAADSRNSMQEELEEALEIAIKGHLERRCFMERLAANRENPLWEILGRSVRSPLVPSQGPLVPPQGTEPPLSLADLEFPVGVLGLNECVKFLTGYEFHQDPRARRESLTIIEAMGRKLERDARGLGLRLFLTETRNAGSVRQMEEADRRRYHQSNEVDRGRQGALEGAGRPERRYADGVRMHRSAPIDPLARIEHLGAFLGKVEPTGLIEDSPELRGGGPELVLSLLEECLPGLCAAGHGSRGPARAPRQ